MIARSRGKAHSRLRFLATERTSRVHSVAGVLAASGILLVLSGCVGGDQPAGIETEGAGATNVETDQSDPATPGGVAAEGEEVAEFYPELSAAANLSYFEYTLSHSGAGAGPVPATELVDALIDAGFETGDIEVTPENSQIALPAESVALAVVFDGECLVGQYTDEWLAVEVLPILPDGTCLVLQPETLD